MHEANDAYSIGFVYTLLDCLLLGVMHDSDDAYSIGFVYILLDC